MNWTQFICALGALVCVNILAEAIMVAEYWIAFMMVANMGFFAYVAMDAEGKR